MLQQQRSFPAYIRNIALIAATTALLGCTGAVVGQNAPPLAPLPAPPLPGPVQIVRLIVELPVPLQSDCKSAVGIAKGTIAMSDGYHNIPDTRIPPVANLTGIDLPGPNDGTAIPLALVKYAQARNMIAASAAIYQGSLTNGLIAGYKVSCSHTVRVPLPAGLARNFPFAPCGPDLCLNIPLPDWDQRISPPKTGFLRFTQADQVLGLSEQVFFKSLP
jgi:hypothetical protein